MSTEASIQIHPRKPRHQLKGRQPTDAARAEVRALIGAFAGQNLVNFHAADGSGYRFLADQVISLNATNPQIASRQLGPLTRWRKYDASRQALMRAELERILASGELSSDVFEVVSKSLA